MLLTGDGSFQMNIQELATARQFDVPVKCVIMDNGYLGMVRQWQELFWDRRYSNVDMGEWPRRTGSSSPRPTGRPASC